MPAILAVAAALFAGFTLSLAHSRPALRRTRAELAAARWLAEHDPLTGLPNRAGARGVSATVTPRASAGIALAQAGNDWADLLRRADIALYHAKAGGGPAVLHDHGMPHRAPAIPRGPRLRERVVRPRQSPPVKV
jgi:GGDEF domain-containing protein